VLTYCRRIVEIKRNIKKYIIKKERKKDRNASNKRNYIGSQKKGEKIDCAKIK